MPTVRDFGARGDGRTDDTAALSHAIQNGDGHLVFSRGDYLISRPLHIPLANFGRFAVTGEDGLARIIMTGPGPALLLVGTHSRSALPAHFAEGVWQRERLPTVSGLEIVGAHAEADGIRIEGAMQPTLHRVLIRRCRHGVHLTARDRNVLIADCHIYDNTGIGIYLDGVNLHQTNLHGNHVSYCKRGGIVIARSEVRNIQICGNDIEYNYDADADASADVLFDCRDGTVREGTIVGNTIQAVKSRGGANVRLLGRGAGDPNAVGLLAITGNLLGSQETVLHLQACRGVTVTGNSIYSGYHHAVRAEDAENLVLSGNSIDHNPEYPGKSTDRILLRNCRNVTLTGTVVQHTRAAEVDDEATLELDGCTNTVVSGCQFLGARRRGVLVRRSSVVRVAGCTIRPGAEKKEYRAAVEVGEGCNRVVVADNFVARGSAGAMLMGEGAGTVGDNVLVD